MEHPPEQDTDHQDTSNQNKKSNLLSSISNNALLLGVFSLICTALIALTFLSTEEKIDIQKKNAALKALLEIVPEDQHDNDLLQDKIVFFEKNLGHRKEQLLFLAKKDNKPSVLIYPVTARDGYSGDIDFIIGININNSSIAGIRIINHKETPGLGDKVELRKSDWVLSFNDKSLKNPTPLYWKVKKEGGEFDAFTGATITPRAIINATKKLLDFHEENAKPLLQKFDHRDS